MDGTHEKENERTAKIKDERLALILILYLVNYCRRYSSVFFQGYEDRTDSFWHGEGKIVRGNQKRGQIEISHGKIYVYH